MKRKINSTWSETNLLKAARIIILNLLVFTVVNVFAQTQELKVRSLPPNQILEREITGAETHRYKFNLKPDEFFQVRVEQKGVDVILKLLDADGNILATMDSPNGKQEFETLSFIALTTGNYTLEVAGFDANMEKGVYIIKRIAPRTATATDKRRVKVERLFVEGMIAAKNSSPTDDTPAKLEEVVKNWQELQDSYMANITALQLTRIKNARARTFFKLAVQYAEKGTKDSMNNALLLLDEARRLTKEIDEKKGESLCLGMLGKVNYNLGNKQKALNYYKQALPLLKAIADKETEAETYISLGKISTQLEDFRKAHDYFAEASSLFKILQNKKGEADMSINIGATYLALEEKQKALEYMNRALALYRDVPDKEGQAITLTNIGATYYKLKDYQKALETYSQALMLWRDIKDQKQEANTLRNIGNVYYNAEEKQKSLEPYGQALLIYQALGDKKDIVGILDQIALAHAALGEKTKTVEYFQKSLALYKELDDVEEQLKTLQALASISLDLGEKLKAIEYNTQALLLNREFEDKNGEAIMLTNIAMIYVQLGEREKARIEYLEKALPLFIEVQNKQGQAWTHNIIGLIYQDLNDYQKALEHYTQAEKLAREANDKIRERNALNGIASIYKNNLGDKQKARNVYLQVLAIDETDIGALHNIANIYSDLGEKQKAIDYYMKAATIALAGSKDLENVALLSLTSIWTRLGNKRLAILFSKLEINKRQELRQAVQGFDNETQKSYLRSHDFIYKDSAVLLIEEGRLAEAVQVLNLYRDQQFFDFNRNFNEPVKQLLLSPHENALASRYEQESEKVARVGRQIEDLERRASTHQARQQETAQLAKLKAELKIVSASFSAFLKEAEKEFAKPLNEQDIVPVEKDVADMQTALQQLNEKTGQKTTAIYQVVGFDKFFALVVTPDHIEEISVPIKGEELNEKAKELWRLLQSDKYDTTKLSKKIYDVVFKPLETKLPKGTTTILWSMDDNLRYVPISALFDGEKFLVERYKHVVFTRADKERMTRNVSKVWTGTGFGSTKKQTVSRFGNQINLNALPGVNAELKGIFKTETNKTGILAGEILSDESFNQENMLDALKQKRPLVHIASHFLFRPGDEARSFLLMGDGTAFTLADMKKQTKLFEGVELLTLSACNTAATQTDAYGREIDGFAELAQRLGADAVIATLWQVSDASTPWLMRDFYSNRQEKKGMTKAEALQKAQIALLYGTAKTKPIPAGEKDDSAAKVKSVIVPKGKKRITSEQTRSDKIVLDESEAPPYKSEGKPKYAHPYYWSPFVLYGNLR